MQSLIDRVYSGSAANLSNDVGRFCDKLNTFIKIAAKRKSIGEPEGKKRFEADYDREVWRVVLPFAMTEFENEYWMEREHQDQLFLRLRLLRNSLVAPLFSTKFAGNDWVGTDAEADRLRRLRAKLAFVVGPVSVEEAAFVSQNPAYRSLSDGEFEAASQFLLRALDEGKMVTQDDVQFFNADQRRWILERAMLPLDIMQRFAVFIFPSDGRPLVDGKAARTRLLQNTRKFQPYMSGYDWFYQSYEVMVKPPINKPLSEIVVYPRTPIFALANSYIEALQYHHMYKERFGTVPFANLSGKIRDILYNELILAAPNVRSSIGRDGACKAYTALENFTNPEEQLDESDEEFPPRDIRFRKVSCSPSYVWRRSEKTNKIVELSLGSYFPSYAPMHSVDYLSEEEIHLPKFSVSADGRQGTTLLERIERIDALRRILERDDKLVESLYNSLFNFTKTYTKYIFKARTEVWPRLGEVTVYSGFGMRRNTSSIGNQISDLIDQELGASASAVSVDN